MSNKKVNIGHMVTVEKDECLRRFPHYVDGLIQILDNHNGDDHQVLENENGGRVVDPTEAHKGAEISTTLMARMRHPHMFAETSTEEETA